MRKSGVVAFAVCRSESFKFTHAAVSVTQNRDVFDKGCATCSASQFFFPSLFFDPGSFQKLQFGMSKLGLLVHGLEHCESLENDACMITCD